MVCNRQCDIVDPILRHKLLNTTTISCAVSHVERFNEISQVFRAHSETPGPIHFFASPYMFRDYISNPSSMYELNSMKRLMCKRRREGERRDLRPGERTSSRKNS